jgi:hypothetical protein
MAIGRVLMLAALALASACGPANAPGPRGTAVVEPSTPSPSATAQSNYAAFVAGCTARGAGTIEVCTCMAARVSDQVEDDVFDITVRSSQAATQEERNRIEGALSPDAKQMLGEILTRAASECAAPLSGPNAGPSAPDSPQVAADKQAIISNCLTVAGNTQPKCACMADSMAGRLAAATLHAAAESFRTNDGGAALQSLPSAERDAFRSAITGAVDACGI